MNHDNEDAWGDQVPVQDHDGTPAGMVTHSDAREVARLLALEVARKRDDSEAVYLAQQAMIAEQREAVSVVNPYLTVYLSSALVMLSAMLEQLGVSREEIDSQIELMLLPLNDIE